MQETFLAAYERFWRLRNHPNINGWLVITIKHKASKYAPDRLEYEEVRELIQDYGLLELIPFDFPEKDAKLLRDRYEEHYSIAQIARKEKKTPNAITVSLFRPRGRLKARLGESSFEDDL